MVRYASGLIFGNCDGHILEGYGTGILNLFGGPSGFHACVGTKLFWKVYFGGAWIQEKKECISILHFWEGGHWFYECVKFMPINHLLHSLFLSTYSCTLCFALLWGIWVFPSIHHIGYGLYRDCVPSPTHPVDLGQALVFCYAHVFVIKLTLHLKCNMFADRRVCLCWWNSVYAGSFFCLTEHSSSIGLKTFVAEDDWTDTLWVKI